jgi:hypothetical protein
MVRVGILPAQPLPRVSTIEQPSTGGSWHEPAPAAEPGYNERVSESRKLTVRCPECASELVVDAATGEVLSHRRHKQPPGGGKDLESLLQGLDQDKARAEDIFQREVAAMKDRDRLLEEKFREAMRRAEEEPDEGPPLRPFDLD